MAKMYPQQLPAEVSSPAERLLYEQFREQLPAEFTVLYSVSWLLRERQPHERDGELDFLLVHPHLGLLVLEVKGGTIGCEMGEWYSRSRSGTVYSIKNPFVQARENKYKLLDKLRSAPATGPYLAEYKRLINHAVAFPDTADAERSIGLEGDARIMLDSSDLGNLVGAVHRLMGQANSKDQLSAAASKALVETLAPTIELAANGLTGAILQEQVAIRTLTEGQFHTLNLLGRMRQAAIGGCAGSGKTMLAIEKARRLAAEGFRVLFVCFNWSLADAVMLRFAQEPPEVRERITTLHYARLVRDLCKQAGVALPTEPKEKEVGAEAVRDYYDLTMPMYLEQAIAALPEERYDAIIVDEGQDFLELWRNTVVKLLRDEAAIFYIFFDDNQRIYGAERTALRGWAGPVFNLDLNCRNTKLIHEEVLRYYQGAERPTSLGPAGRAPLRFAVEQGDKLKGMRQALHEVLVHQGLAASEVVVLTPLGKERSAFKDGLKLGNWTFSWHRELKAGEVRVSTIHRFKGLERTVVILAELLEAHDGPERDYLMYVALSRACHQLVVVGELPPPRWEGEMVTVTELLTEMEADKVD